MISLDQVVSKDESTASRVLGDEAVVLTPMDSKIHSLNETGTRIWELLADKPTVGEIISQIHREFKVDEEQAKEDVTAFLEELAEKGMIKLSESSQPS